MSLVCHIEKLHSFLSLKLYVFFKEIKSDVGESKMTCTFMWIGKIETSEKLLWVT